MKTSFAHVGMRLVVTWLCWAWLYVQANQVILYLGHALLMLEDKKKGAESNSGSILKGSAQIGCISCSFTIYWPKQVTGPIPKSMFQEKYILPTGKHGQQIIQSTIVDNMKTEVVPNVMVLTWKRKIASQLPKLKKIIIVIARHGQLCMQCVPS